MAWNNRQHFTRDSFCRHVYSVAREMMSGERVEPIDGALYLPYWWINGEIRVFWEPSIPRQTVDFIVGAVDQRAQEVLQLKFNFQLYGNDASSTEQVSAALVNGQLDPDRLSAIAASEPWRDWSRGGRQHADIYITDKQFVDDPVSWAAAGFMRGTMVFCLHGQRRHPGSFLRSVTFHETGHLLGMYSHCDDYQNVDGLPYTTRCNMHYACTHEELCSKCRTQIKWWWQGVQDEARQAGMF